MKSLTVRLADSQHQQVRRIAYAQGCSIADVIRMALAEHITRHQMGAVAEGKNADAGTRTS